MYSLNKLIKLANKFDYKLKKYAEELTISNLYFFSNADKQEKFSKKLQEGVSNILTKYYEEKSGTPSKVHIKIELNQAEGKTQVIFQISPSDLEDKVMNFVKSTYKSLFKESFDNVIASAKAKVANTTEGSTQTKVDVLCDVEVS